MKDTRIIMGMPVKIEISHTQAKKEDLDIIFDYFVSIDNRFSTYKKDSEISRYNEKKITYKDLSSDMKLILSLAEDTKQETDGYFNIMHDDVIDPSGIVKGWAVYNAAQLLKKNGFTNFMVDAGGDIEVSGVNDANEQWRIGIGSPFTIQEIIKVFSIQNQGIATSGNYIRKAHIYNPRNKADTLSQVASITVIGPTVYDADRFATAAFAMGEKGIHFIEKLDGYEGYMIASNGTATMTGGLWKYIAK